MRVTDEMVTNLINRLDQLAYLTVRFHYNSWNESLHSSVNKCTQLRSILHQIRVHSSWLRNTPSQQYCKRIHSVSLCIRFLYHLYRTTVANDYERKKERKKAGRGGEEWNRLRQRQRGKVLSVSNRGICNEMNSTTPPLKLHWLVQSKHAHGQSQHSSRTFPHLKSCSTLHTSRETVPKNTNQKYDQQFQYRKDCNAEWRRERNGKKVTGLGLVLSSVATTQTHFMRDE